MDLAYFTRRERTRRRAAAWHARLQNSPSAADRSAFERWCRADPQHRQAYDRIASTWNAAAQLRHSDVARSTVLPDRPTPVPQRLRHAVAAGCIVVAAAAGALLVQTGGEPDIQERLLLTTAVGEVRDVPLDDGSRLTLDTDSAVSIHLGEQRRQVTLSKGRVRVAIAAERRPFVVHAGTASVSAEAGTADISVAAEGASITSIEGAFRVSHGPEAHRSEILVPAQTQLELPRTGAAGTPRALEGGTTAWTAGMMEFDDTPLKDVLEQANRYSRTKIRLTDPALERLRVTGAFRSGDSAALARSLAAAFDLRLDSAAGGDLLLRRRP